MATNYNYDYIQSPPQIQTKIKNQYPTTINYIDQQYPKNQKIQANAHTYTTTNTPYQVITEKQQPIYYEQNNTKNYTYEYPAQKKNQQFYQYENYYELIDNNNTNNIKLKQVPTNKNNIKNYNNNNIQNYLNVNNAPQQQYQMIKQDKNKNNFQNIQDYTNLGQKQVIIQDKNIQNINHNITSNPYQQNNTKNIQIQQPYQIIEQTQNKNNAAIQQNNIYQIKQNQGPKQQKNIQYQYQQNNQNIPQAKQNIQRYPQQQLYTLNSNPISNPPNQNQQKINIYPQTQPKMQTQQYHQNQQQIKTVQQNQIINNIPNQNYMINYQQNQNTNKAQPQIILAQNNPKLNNNQNHNVHQNLNIKNNGHFVNQPIYQQPKAAPLPPQKTRIIPYAQRVNKFNKKGIMVNKKLSVIEEEDPNITQSGFDKKRSQRLLREENIPKKNVSKNIDNNFSESMLNSKRFDSVINEKQKEKEENNNTTNNDKGNNKEKLKNENNKNNNVNAEKNTPIVSDDKLAHLPTIESIMIGKSEPLAPSKEHKYK